MGRAVSSHNALSSHDLQEWGTLRQVVFETRGRRTVDRKANLNAVSRFAGRWGVVSIEAGQVAIDARPNDAFVGYSVGSTNNNHSL